VGDVLNQYFLIKPDSLLGLGISWGQTTFTEVTGALQMRLSRELALGGA
jgi:hypothetical protein